MMMMMNRRCDHDGNENDDFSYILGRR